jgi:hypothetical protein
MALHFDSLKELSQLSILHPMLSGHHLCKTTARAVRIHFYATISADY